MMKKKILVCLVLAQGLLLCAQENEYQKKAQEIVINPIKEYASNELIPYYASKDQKWGYMDRNSKKKLTKPFTSEPLFFHPNLELSLFQRELTDLDSYGTIKGSTFNYDSSDFGKIRLMEPEIDCIDRSKTDDSHLLKESIAGFEVDNQGELSAIGAAYFDSELKKKTIIELIVFQNQYRAIINHHKNDTSTYSIINQEGETIKGFEHITAYPETVTRYTAQKDVWMYVKEGDKFKIKGLFSGEEKGVFDDEFHNGSYKNYSGLGYTIARMNGQDGVLDLLTMEWKIKPSKANKFKALFYSTLKELDGNPEQTPISTEVVEYNRKHSYIYILNDKNTFYDLEMNEYKPKNSK